jgi:nickel superoxide dismutase|tara:strand:+ start:1124 stop:1615 length:492 start_codon:yes stop_codon:yes gene_type:complete
MLHNLISKLDKNSVESAAAHCDVPCKIYDPSMIIVPALTVVRMLDIMAELADRPMDLATVNTLSRAVAQKEEHAAAVKHQTVVIWGDYFKAPQFEQFPNASELVHSIMLQASKCKVGTDRNDGVELVNLVNQFVEMFWATKNVKTKRAVSPYPPALEVVYPDL